MKKEITETRKITGALGGKSRKNKSRKMKGMKLGRGSAGRAASANGRGQVVSAPVASSYFPDVKAACNEWLRAKGLQVGGFREMMSGDIHEARRKHA